MGQNLQSCSEGDEISWRRQRWMRNAASRNVLLSNIASALQKKKRRVPNTSNRKRFGELQEFTDLYNLPPEIALEVLRNLNATDLCLASCVWNDLANDETLWEGLCKANWGFCNAYDTWRESGKSYKKLYLILDEACLTFNFQPAWGINYLVDNAVLNNNGRDIAMFIHFTNQLYWRKVRYYLRKRQDVFDELQALQDYKNQFLPNALRKFFNAVESPTSQGQRLNQLIDTFSKRFCNDNPNLELTPEVVNIVCFSLILLSVDLSSPHVKNKMSKREFIRNICTALEEETRRRNHTSEEHGQGDAARAHFRAISVVDKDFAGHLYDNIYLIGHVAKEKWAE